MNIKENKCANVEYRECSLEELGIKLGERSFKYFGLDEKISESDSIQRKRTNK